ncbi:MAG: NADH-quinone oxidoreductase subunit J [Anaerolineae bacterium]|nr:NADH-quinone oxidoreductase subunit J [Anaerolineae bacterium]
MPDFSTLDSISELLPLPLDQIVWIVMTIFTLGGGFGVVFARSLYHSALYLVMSFFGVAGFYVLLSAGFLAVVQLTVYVGAIAILILFAIMFSRSSMAADGKRFNGQWWLGFIMAVGLFLVLVVVVGAVDWPLSDTGPTLDMVEALGEAFLGSYLIPFQIIGVLLSVALIGGVMLAREKTEAEKANS